MNEDYDPQKSSPNKKESSQSKHQPSYEMKVIGYMKYKK